MNIPDAAGSGSAVYVCVFHPLRLLCELHIIFFLSFAQAGIKPNENTKYMI